MNIVTKKSTNSAKNWGFLFAHYWVLLFNHLYKAKIVADAFHVVTNINRILDKKRIQVMNYYLKLENENLNYSNDFGYLLKKFSWMIRHNKKNIKGRYLWIYKYKFSVYSMDLLEHLLSSNKELK